MYVCMYVLYVCMYVCMYVCIIYMQTSAGKNAEEI